MSDFKTDVEVKATDKASGPLRRIGRGLGRLATGPIRGLSAAIGKLGSGITSVKGLLAGLVAHRLVAGISNMVNAYVTAGDELAKFGRQIGLGVEGLQELEYAAQRSGVDSDVLRDGLKELTKQLGEAGMKTGTLYDILGQTSPAFRKQVLEAGSTEEAFNLLIDALGRIEDPTKRAVLSAAAFGEEAGKLQRLAEGGVEGLARLREEARKNGLMTEEGAKAAEDFADAQLNLKMAIQGAKVAIGGQLLPILQPMLERLTAWITANRELIAGKVTTFIEKVAGAIDNIDFDAIVAGFGWIKDHGELVATAVGAVAMAMAGGPFGAFVAGLALVITHFEKIVEWGNKAADVITDFTDQLGLTKSPTERMREKVAASDAQTPESMRRDLAWSALMRGDVEGYQRLSSERTNTLANVRSIFRQAQAPAQIIQDQPSLFASFAPPAAAPAGEATVRVEFANAPQGLKVIEAQASGVQVETHQKVGQRTGAM